MENISSTVDLLKYWEKWRWQPSLRQPFIIAGLIAYCDLRGWTLLGLLSSLNGPSVKCAFLWQCWNQDRLSNLWSDSDFLLVLLTGTVINLPDEVRILWPIARHHVGLIAEGKTNHKWWLINVCRVRNGCKNIMMDRKWSSKVIACSFKVWGWVDTIILAASKTSEMWSLTP